MCRMMEAGGGGGGGVLWIGQNWLTDKDRFLFLSVKLGSSVYATVLQDAPQVALFSILLAQTTGC